MNGRKAGGPRSDYGCLCKINPFDRLRACGWAAEMKLMLVDDTRLVRDSLASLLRVQGFEVIAEASNGREALAKADTVRPDVILMDIRMPHMGGLEATRLIKTRHPDVKIVMLTVSEDEHDLFEAIKSGADGYLLKDLTAAELFEELESIGRGQGAVITKSLAGKLLAEFKRYGDQPSKNNNIEGVLTLRELEVLRLVAQGFSNRRAGDSLSISENTVKYHMKQILDKLHLENRAQVIAWAARHMSLPGNS